VEAFKRSLHDVSNSIKSSPETEPFDGARARRAAAAVILSQKTSSACLARR
jgi:hypothetical protein